MFETVARKLAKTVLAEEHGTDQKVGQDAACRGLWHRPETWPRRCLQRSMAPTPENGEETNFLLMSHPNGQSAMCSHHMESKKLIVIYVMSGVTVQGEGVWKEIEDGIWSGHAMGFKPVLLGQIYVATVEETMKICKSKIRSD